MEFMAVCNLRVVFVVIPHLPTEFVVDDNDDTDVELLVHRIYSLCFWCLSDSRRMKRGVGMIIAFHSFFTTTTTFILFCTTFFLSFSRKECKAKVSTCRLCKASAVHFEKKKEHIRLCLIREHGLCQSCYRHHHHRHSDR